MSKRSNLKVIEFMNLIFVMLKLYSISDGFPVYAVAYNNHKRRLVLGGSYEQDVTPAWSAENKVVVPILCRQQKFEIIQLKAYRNHELDDWCY